MRSLRRRLVAWLLPPLVVVGVVAAAGAYVFMDRRIAAAYDQNLGDIARALAPYIRANGDSLTLDFSRQADAILRADSQDDIYYAVIDQAGRLVAGDHALPSPPAMSGDGPFFWDDVRDRLPIRVVALRQEIAGRTVHLIAAETTRKRERASRDALLSAIVPVALLSGAAILAVLFGVGRGLGPLERLRQELQARSHVDLSPVDEVRVVQELRPVVRELNGMLARLEAAQNSQARFIANAAHQLRTPIAGLVTQLDLARASAAGRETHIEHARQGAARLARLAQQILSLAAADPVSNPGATDAKCDLAEVVRDQADTWLRATTERGVELEFDLGPAPIVGNGLLVGELASNLVDNAARYGAKTVRIATHRNGKRSLLEVSDDGPGIPAEQRTRIFERFHRLQNNGSAEGSGLGLAIVHEIAQRHGAAVEVDDAPSGRGTCIRVLFG
jgi:two-component system sensor histidine kinase TctE